MAFISGISITCFAACYLIALGLEVARLLFRRRVPARAPAIVCLIGWLTQSLYLIAQAQDEITNRAIAPLSSWYDFCLLIAWVMTGVYLGLSLRRPDNALGAFFLPLVLAALGVAIMFRDTASFPAGRALNIWRIVHGVTLLLGTTAVVMGFATGLMYLLQSYRLKHKLPAGGRFRLPSLEWLQKFNREALLVSTGLLAIGLLSGVVLKLIAANNVAWHDPVVLSSGVLFLWLVAVTVFESVYKPARQGHKVAYLTLANFVFLSLALYFVLFGSHAVAPRTLPATTVTRSLQQPDTPVAEGTAR